MNNNKKLSVSLSPDLDRVSPMSIDSMSSNSSNSSDSYTAVTLPTRSLSSRISKRWNTMVF